MFEDVDLDQVMSVLEVEVLYDGLKFDVAGLVVEYGGFWAGFGGFHFG